MYKKIRKILIIFLIFINCFCSFSEDHPDYVWIGDQVFTWEVAMAGLKWLNEQRGWVYTPVDEWHYVAENGDFVKNAVVKKDDMEFYLDDKGHVVKDQLIDIDNATYYCNYFGALAKNCWVKVDAIDVENKLDTNPAYYYYYFDGEGKAIKGSTEKPLYYTIDGLSYLFNSEGQMLTGWLTEKGEVIDPMENDKPFEEAVYFATDYGNLASGWVSYENPYTDNEDIVEMGKLWFYFDPKTHKKRGNGKEQLCNIGPASYVFSDKGYLYTGFVYYNTNNENKEEYFGDEKNGGKYSAKWAYTIPPKDGSYSEEEIEKKNWMYLQKGGIPIKNAMRKVNGEYYAFDENGIMRTGIVAFLYGKILFVTDMDNTSGEDIIKKGKYTYKRNGETYYFYDPSVKFVDEERKWYYAGNDGFDITPSLDLTPRYEFPTMDEEINKRRNFCYTGRRIFGTDRNDLMTYGQIIHDDIGADINPNIKFFYFGDGGEKIEGEKEIHMLDDKYIFGSNRSGHFNGKKGDKYYCDGFLLRADDEIGYGIVAVDDSLPQTKHHNLYEYWVIPKSYRCSNSILVDENEDVVEENHECRPTRYDGYRFRELDNEGAYKVLNPQGKVVKSKKDAYKDKQGRYWFVDGAENSFRGLYEVPIRRMKSKVTLNTLLDESTCPNVFKTGTKKEKIDYFNKAMLVNPPDMMDCKYLAEDLFANDFKDYYCFLLSGTIKDVEIEKSKDDPNKFQVSLVYDGVHFKTDYNEMNCYIPLGIKDDHENTASYFISYNDYAILPDDNDLLINFCWDDKDAIDMYDRDGDGEVDY